MLNKHSLRFAAIGMVVCAVVLAGLAVSPKPACADSYSCWLPYVLMGNGTGECPWFGNDANLYHQIDSPTTDNVVWPDLADVGSNTEVYWTATREKSEYDQKGGASDFDLSIHNPTANEMVIAIWVCNASDGSIVDENDDRIDHEQTDLTDPTWLEWSDGWNVFFVTVPSKYTRVIKQEDMFPVAEMSHSESYVLKLWSCGENADYFAARYRHCHKCQWRTGTGDTDFSSVWYPYYFSYGHTALGEDLLDGITSPRLVLPYWKDTRGDDDGEEWSTGVHVINIETVDQDITVTVYERDGTQLDSFTFDDVKTRQKVTFIPSQFLDSTSEDTEGWLEVTAVLSSDGETRGDILGFANLTRFSNACTFWGYNGKFQSNHTAHFFVEDDG